MSSFLGSAFLKKTENSPSHFPRSHQLSTAPLPGVGLDKYLLHSYRYFGWLDLVQLLRVHVCNCAVKSSKYCFSEYVRYFWLLKSSSLTLFEWSLSLVGRRYDIDVPFRAELCGLLVPILLLLKYIYPLSGYDI